MNELVQRFNRFFVAAGELRTGLKKGRSRASGTSR